MFVHPKPAQLRLLPLLVASMFCATAQAQQTGNQLEDVKVEAGIIPESLELVPGSTSVIDAADLEQRIPFSIQDAMRSVTGVNVVGETAFDVAPNIGLRGLNPRRSARTLLLEDGMPIFLAPYGDPSAHYSTPFERLERIEVLKGSGQILYGPQSVGGMINFVTKPVPRNGFAGNASASAGTNGFYGLSANVGTGGEWGGVMLDMIKKEGDGIRENHDFDVTETMFKGEFVLSSRQTLTTKVGYYTERSQTSETGLGSVEFAENPRQAPTGNNDHFQHDRTTVQLIHKLSLSDSAVLTTQAYYTDSFRSSLRQINSSGGNAGRSQLERCPGGVDVNNLNNANLCGGRTRPRDYQFFGIEPKLDFSHKALGMDNIATVGMRYHKEDIQRRAFRANTLGELIRETPNINREDILADITATSFYAQNTFIAGNWSFTPGLRYEEIDQTTNIVRAEGVNVGQVNTVRKSEVLPGFGVTWGGLESTTLFAGVHKGFAPPRPDRDLAVNVVGGVPTTTFSTPDPEESTNTEIGVRTTYFQGFNIEATLFNIDFDNLVLEDNGRFLNAGKSVHRGLELGAVADLDRLFDTKGGYFASLGWTHLSTARFDEDRINPGSNIIGNRLPYAPRNIVNLAVGFNKSGPWSAQIGVSHVSDQFVDDINSTRESLNGEEGTVPSYTLWNASVNYKPAGSALSYFLAAENLFDEEYLASRVDGKQLGRGQQVVVGIRTTF